MSIFTLISTFPNGERRTGTCWVEITDISVPPRGEIGPELISYKINSYIPEGKKPSWKDFSRSNREKKFFPLPNISLQH